MPNYPATPRRRHGFTMLEMSMVIVIIALLLGAMTAMQNYVRNAKLKTMMNESKAMISAFNQFQGRYNSIPGDFKDASTNWAAAASTNGDGNGLIRATGSAPGNRGEWYYTFQHLSLAGYITGAYTGATAGSGGTFYAKIGLNVPSTSADKVTFLFDHPDNAEGIVSADSLYFDGTYGNLLRIAKLDDGTTSFPDQPFISPKDANQIDEKYDDGMPGLGLIVAPKSSALSGCATTDVAASAAYNTGTDAIACYLFQRIQ